MKKTLVVALALALGTTTAFAADAATRKSSKSASAAKPAKAVNSIFNSDSPLPLHYPQFDKIKDSDFGPGLDLGMAQQLKEVDAIVNNKAAPTFENTIVAMEKSGRTLYRTASVFFNLQGTDTNPARDQIDETYAPKLAAHDDKISLNPKLFQRIETVYNARNSSGLNPEQIRLVERYYENFVRSGAKLSAADQAKIKSINGQLADLGTKFSQNVLKEVNDSAVVVDTAEELRGLSEDEIKAAAKAAETKGLKGKYLVKLLNTTGQPPLTNLENRALRERIYKASVARGSRGNAFDNTGIIAQVTKLRAERAALLGFPTYADYALQNQTAKTPQAVNDMLNQLVGPAVANARKEGADLQAMIDAEQKAKGEPTFALEAWDWAYYTEKVRQAKYNFDETQLKPYFEMKNVLENGVFYAANQEFGLTFKERTDLPKYHPDTWVYDVFDKDGSQLAIFIFDPYARASKRGGAWMNSYVDQSALTGFKPVVANHLNIQKPEGNAPTLMTWDEVTTTFHEFGHALHGMFSNVTYPTFSGTSVPRDFVEFPSQVNEMWADWPEILANYAKHYQTGAAMPKELLDKVLASSKFNQGFTTTEYLGAAMLDQSWHQRAAKDLPDAKGVVAFEDAALKANRTDYTAVPPRYKTPYFSHIMGGYAAGYYAYIWSEVLDAGTVKWFKDNGGLSQANGQRFRDALLSRGGSKDAVQLYRDFTGQDPNIQPLLERRGLTTEGSTDAGK